MWVTSLLTDSDLRKAWAIYLLKWELGDVQSIYLEDFCNYAILKDRFCSFFNKKVTTFLLKDGYYENKTNPKYLLLNKAVYYISLLIPLFIYTYYRYPYYSVFLDSYLDR